MCNYILSYQSKLATTPGSHKVILLEVIHPEKKEERAERNIFNACVHECLMKPARATHHDICHTVKEGSYSQAENHLLYSENDKKTRRDIV